MQKQSDKSARVTNNRSSEHSDLHPKPGMIFLLLTHLMLLGPAFFWGLNPMVMKIGLRYLPAFPYNTLRLLAGIVVMAPLIFLPGAWKPVRRQDVLTLFAIPVAGFFIFQALFTLGVEETPASVAAIILGTLPINVAVINRILKIESLSAFKVLGICATCAGVVFIAVGGGADFSAGGMYLRGVLMLVVGEISYGLYTIYLKPLTRYYPPPQIILIILIGAVPVFFALSIIRDGLSAYRGVNAMVLGSACFSGIFALAMANILWSIGVNRLGSVNTSVYGNLPPVFGVAAGMLFLGESLSLLQLLGAAAILSGIVLVNRKRKDPR